MRVRIDPNICQGHAMCALACPEVFKLNDEDGHAYLLDVYRGTAESPARARTAGADATLGSLTEDAARLVGPGGELPEDLHRPLLALATHRQIARPVFGALKLGYRVSSELGRRRQRRK